MQRREEMEFIRAKNLGQLLTTGAKVLVVDVTNGTGSVSIAGSMVASSVDFAAREADAIADLCIAKGEGLSVVFVCEHGQVRSPVCAKAFLAKLSERKKEGSMKVFVLEGGLSCFKHEFGDDPRLTEKRL